jgi:putative transposase
MPRKARIDAPGALQHIIIRGIERKAIFRDDHDKEKFIGRLGTILQETSTKCYAWALLSNHAHLLLRTGVVPIATVMRRALTGYAQQFNRRYRRHGQLFQNRYKSILCEEDLYLLELVRYIHLNPLRAGLAKDLRALRSYRYGGHSVLVGRYRNEWHDKEYVLSFFGATEKTARKEYVSFVRKGLDQGRRPELVGGGLVRSVGGWFALQALRSEPMRVKGDERILGSSEFVEEVLEKADEHFEQRTLIRSRGIDPDTLLSNVARYFRIDAEDLKTASKLPDIVKARAVYCYGAVRKLYVSGASIARQLHISPSAVSKAVIRGQEIVRDKDLETVLLEMES